MVFERLFGKFTLSAVHAKARGADSWWMSFTTGKSARRLGGVPHDTYGMTSLSIRQYVLGIYKHLGLREKDITKVQTGGPGSLFNNCSIFGNLNLIRLYCCRW